MIRRGLCRIPALPARATAPRVGDQTVRARTYAKGKLRAEQAIEGAQAWAEYQSQSRTVAEKNKLLKELRLAIEAARSKSS
jgi:hypothetical protein